MTALAADAEEVVLALSISYPVDEPAIATTFPGLPVMHMKMSELSSNAHWSVEKQSAIAEQFHQALKEIAGQGAKTIHLVIAAPTSCECKSSGTCGSPCRARYSGEAITKRRLSPSVWNASGPSGGPPKRTAISAYPAPMSTASSVRTI